MFNIVGAKKEMGWRRNTAVLFAGIALVCLASIPEVKPNQQQQGCSQTEDRCIPIRNCPVYFSRVKAKEHLTNRDLRIQLRRLICRQDDQIDPTPHICCPKESIRCTWNDSPAVCTRPASCPSFGGKDEQELMLSNETAPCYAYNHKKFYCCPDAICAMQSGLCDADDETSPWKRSPTAFPGCAEDAGSLVPFMLCSNSMPFPGETKTCCKGAPEPALIPHPKAIRLATMRCGYQGDGYKIQNGNITHSGEFPWMVVLRYSASKAVCAGTLIHPRYVLTAAHCIKKKQIAQVTVRLGVHDLRASDTCLGADECPPHVQEIAIAEKIIHSQRDIALLRLSRPADLVPGAVVPICLPIYDQLLMHLPTKLTITGWGMSTDLRISSDVLRKADTRVLADQTGCGMEHTFCAGGKEYSNHCPGDSGGPYQAQDMYDGHVRYVQYGVISSGSRYCEHPDTPSKGMLVGYFIQWILDNMDLS